MLVAKVHPTSPTCFLTQGRSKFCQVVPPCGKFESSLFNCVISSNKRHFYGKMYVCCTVKLLACLTLLTGIRKAEREEFRNFSRAVISRPPLQLPHTPRPAHAFHTVCSCLCVVWNVLKSSSNVYFLFPSRFLFWGSSYSQPVQSYPSLTQILRT